MAEQQTLETQRLPATTSVGEVRLRVASLTNALGFYETVLGYQATELADGSVALSANGGVPDFVLTEHPNARRRSRRTTGLYHAAILLPTRRDLARMVRRLVSQQWNIGGASDHLVSEALYLNDAEGNGIEIYADRPRDAWPTRGGQVEMATNQLDFDSLFAELEGADPEWNGMPAGTRIGHLHLQVSDLDESRRFYVDTLGFDVMQESYPGALFVAAGGYHHHIGMNVWAGHGVPQPPEDAIGLTRFSILLPEGHDLGALVSRLEATAVPTQRLDDSSVVVTDPNGIDLLLRYG